MSDSILIIGGARSGKSRFALDLAEQMEAKEKIFIATCVPSDAEMQTRIARHQIERGGRWKTLEVPVGIAAAISEHHLGSCVILVDCLTLWINNILSRTEDEMEIRQYTQELVGTIEKGTCPLILVANEVGSGIVPANRLARLFRDVAGRVNQQVAAACRKVFLMVAGIPVPIKKTDAE